jgi:hypothetical protein
MRHRQMLDFISAIGAIGNSANSLMLANAGQHTGSTRRYPEWKSTRKTKGKRDASLRSRSNRRKAGR